MLLCPQCQFENPNTNKFCQRCGTSLTHKTCQECGTQVPVNATTCHNCGAFAGTVWWAIISKELDSLLPPTGSPEAPFEASDLVASNTAEAEVPQIQVPIATDNTEQPQPETAPETTLVPSSASSPLSLEEAQQNIDPPEVSVQADIEESSDEGVTQPLIAPPQSNFLESTSEDNTKDEASSPTSPGIYLDPQHRYRLLEPQSLQKQAIDEETHYGVAVRVLDCQPFQKSPLEALMDQQQGISNKFERSMTQEARQLFPVTMPSETWKILGIPAIAHPYLALHEAYYPTLPEVHDAWQQDGEAVLLLEDRSGWQLLCDLWGSEQLSPLQILYWLDEMAKLWEALEPWHYCQSLLEITNLRVDEDQALGLQRLYPDTTEQQPTLRDLGEMWQMLFHQSQRTQFTSLVGVFRQMCSSEIGTIQELRTQLEAIAHEQQASATGVSQYTDPAISPTDSETSGITAQDQGAAFPTKPPLADLTPGDEQPDEPIDEPPDLPTVILPMQLMSLDDAGCTDIGHQREHNEDCFGIYTQIKKQETSMGRVVQARGLYILCDGMGGHAAGEVASAMAVERIKRYFQDNWQEQLPTEESVREAVRVANLAIYDVNQQNARSGSGRMGTTLAMMLIQNTKVVVAHVGDSRIYRLTRKRGLEQLTVDHEVGERERQRGVDPEIAYSRPDAYQLTQALGPRSEQFVNPDVQYLELNEDTLFVLCSDGLSDNDLIETYWQTHLAPLLSSRANLELGILQLVELANEHNGHDNITAILIRVKVRPNFEQQLL